MTRDDGEAVVKNTMWEKMNEEVKYKSATPMKLTKEKMFVTKNKKQSPFRG